MFKVQEGIGSLGERVPGPPWILGHRGTPRSAPENTLSGLTMAVDAGLDGIEYDLHACATGEPVLIHDETLERTTDGEGLVSELTLPELAGIDAGGWFSKRFVGEPLPLLQEALNLTGREPGVLPRHMIELKDPGLVPEVAQMLQALPQPISFHIASFHRNVCLEARDRGLPSMFLGLRANEEDRRFVRDERITAYGTAPGGWASVAGAQDWDCERWSWSVDEPEDLLAACRMPLFGINTNEPRRALATRALVHLTPHDDGPYPIEVPRLEVPVASTARDAERQGEWSGRWEVVIGLRNPFGFPVRATLVVEVKGGAFEVDGAPARAELAAGERVEVPLKIAGGSWSPYDDPVVHVAFDWEAGPGRKEERLVLDAPLARTRTMRLADHSTRLPMLTERPGDASASMTLRRRGRELLAWVEDAGGLSDLRAQIRLDSEVKKGGRGVRIHLPEDFDRRPEGLPFVVGFEGRDGDGRDPRRLRRWCGGLPYGLFSGATGRLLPARA